MWGDNTPFIPCSLIMAMEIEDGKCSQAARHFEFLCFLELNVVKTIVKHPPNHHT